MNSFRGRIYRSKIVRLKKVLVRLSEFSTEEINNLIFVIFQFSGVAGYTRTYFVNFSLSAWHRQQ